jgi:hypothetical protein
MSAIRLRSGDHPGSGHAGEGAGNTLDDAAIAQAGVRLHDHKRGGNNPDGVGRIEGLADPQGRGGGARKGKRVTQPAAVPGRRLQRDRRLTRQRAGDQIIDGARRSSQQEYAEEITGLREVERHR